MKLLKDGNFSFPVRTILLIVGVGIGAISFYIHSLLLMSVGLVIAAIAGYASKARSLKIKPFDNAYKNAKNSYREDDTKS